MSTKKEIVIVTSEFPPQPGGIGNHAYNLARIFSNLSYDVTVITDNRSVKGKVELDFDLNQNFKVHRISITSPRFLMYFKRIQKVTTTINSDSFVIATGKFSLWNVALSSLFKSFNRIAVVHGSEVNLNAKILKLLVDKSLSTFHGIVAVSNYTKSLINHINVDKEVIPNGIDLEIWGPDQRKSPVNKPINLVTVGRISERKGQHMVVEHMNTLKNDAPELNYHCIGIKDQVGPLESKIRNFDLSNRITFHGTLVLTDMINHLNQCDIFVMLSTQTQEGDVEGFGIAILEANALGLPAIGAKGSGINDAINDGQSGILIDGNSATEFSSAIQKILNDYESYSKGAKEWAQQHDWNNLITKYQKLIH